ncbi:TMEM175 family protein [Agrococcus versicolor]|uniref:TMEM175 family protein n=2 Tax=Agrococcus versicolor TaxID=501482 RepID=A0ABN3AJP5_9MICO
MVFFSDAVVAIAMTLLILPLMESVAEGGGEGLTAADWAAEHGDQLLGFGISFVLVAIFWRWHHGFFDRVRRSTPTLMRWNFAWLLLIVWLPVATALSTVEGGDASNVIVYVTTIAAVPLVSAVIHLHVVRHPGLVDEDRPLDPRGLAANVSLVILLVAALALALLLPDVGYLALLLAAATPLMVRVLHRPLARLVHER